MRMQRFVSPKTFAQRLLLTALLWGMPMIFAELIGIPRRLWLYALIFVVPATAVGVFCWAMLEQSFAKRNR
jgi:hypothetical protein